MEITSFFNIIESFFEKINPINHYKVYNNIYQEENSIYQEEEIFLFEVIKSFFDNLYENK